MNITKTAMVTICGRPNVGKSSLTNALVGEKVAIVSNKAQTTRNRICGIVTRGDTQFVFVDTPGYHRARTKLGDYMVNTVRESIADVDATILVRALAGRVQTQETAEAVYKIGCYEFVPASKVLRTEKCEIVLPAREAEVLVRLCRDAGRTVNTSMLLKELWGDDNYFNLRSLNVYITRLRNHFKEDASVEIESIRGVGYKLKG